MNAAQQNVTPWACKRMLPEYQYAIGTEAATRYSFTGPSAEAPTTCLVRGTKTYAVDMQSWQCRCAFSVTLKLPCRHVFFAPKSVGMKMLVTLAQLDQRWSRALPIPAKLDPRHKALPLPCRP